MPGHWRMPLALDTTGRLATVDQDSADDIAQSVALLIETHPGERTSVPDYGMPEYLFTPTGQLPLAVAVARTVGLWEDRALPVDVELAATTATATGTPGGPGDSATFAISPSTGPTS